MEWVDGVILVLPPQKIALKYGVYCGLMEP